jgi:hypothetical protein
MEANQFDRVAKAVGQGTARRRLLAGLLGVVLAGSLDRATGSAKGKRQHRLQTQRGDNDQGDTRKPTGAACKQNAQCRSGVCGVATSRKPRRCCDASACGECETCDSSGQCVPVGDPFAGPSIPCGGQAFCSCARTREGTAICVDGGAQCNGGPICTTDADCERLNGSGARCLLTTYPNCAGFFCAKSCPTS